MNPKFRTSVCVLVTSFVVDKSTEENNLKAYHMDSTQNMDRSIGVNDPLVSWIQERSQWKLQGLFANTVLGLDYGLHSTHGTKMYHVDSHF